MPKYFFIAIIIPVVIFFSAINFTALRNFDNYFKADSAGRILGVKEAYSDDLSRVMIVEKNTSDKAAEIINDNSNNYSPEILDINSKTCSLAHLIQF